MEVLARDPALALYERATLEDKALVLEREHLDRRFLPALLRASDDFAQARARAAARRANLPETGALTEEQAIAAIVEVLFDRQFRNGKREGCDRVLITEDVRARLARRHPIDMVIVALPHKLNCPLKGYGARADLAEIDFLLGLKEIVTAVDHIAARQRDVSVARVRARFTVVCDGDRFAGVTRTSAGEMVVYRAELVRWLRRLHIGDAVRLVPYKALLEERLPAEMLAEKSRLKAEAEHLYSTVMWPLFDADDLAGTLHRAARADPDPEPGNPRGRFVSLVKSLMFTINYTAMLALPDCGPDPGARRYRMLVSRLFDKRAHLRELAEMGFSAAFADELREAMLRDVWGAAIAYVAEIKSDRELPRDPILACLPGFLRWTIHPKPGQLGLMVPFALGKPIVPWAGVGYVRRFGEGGLALCTMPRLAAEGAGAAPVFLYDSDGQPFCYLDPTIPADTIEGVLRSFETSFSRHRKR
jgi:hypothetical protein